MTTNQMVVENGMKEINAKLATAALAAIIEMPTFKESKIEFAPEGNDGMFQASFTKNERLDVDCYGNVSEQETYEIGLYDVLGGDKLLTVSVENGECYIEGESIELFDISTKAIVEMLTFMHGEGDFYDGAFEEVVFSPVYDQPLEIPPFVHTLVNDVMGPDNLFEIVDWDLKRITLEHEGNEMIIRTWDITENYVRWTLFEMVNDSGKEVSEGTYFFESEEIA